MDVTLLEFGGGHSAQVVRPRQFADLAAAIAGLGLCEPRPVLVVVGGASGLDESGKERLSVLFRQALVPVAVTGQAVVVDGGTDAGVMQLIGRARATGTSGFPLVGVAAENTVMLPGDGADPVTGRRWREITRISCWCRVRPGGMSRPGSPGWRPRSPETRRRPRS